MKQIKFITLTNSYAVANSVVQNPDGTIECHLIPGSIKITHNYHKNDLMIIRFMEFDEEYIIEMDFELLEILKLSLDSNPETTIHEYCISYLHKR